MEKYSVNRLMKAIELGYWMELQSEMKLVYYLDIRLEIT